MMLAIVPVLKTSLIKVEAKSSYSHYAMACGAYEVDTISDDGQFIMASCHDDFSSANSAMSGYSDAVVRHAGSYSANQIIAMTRGYAYSYGNRDDLSTLTITQNLNDWTAKTTYISNYRMMYYEQTRSYEGDGTGTVAVNAYGFEGNVELKDVDLVPAKFVDRGMEIWIGGNDISSENDPDWVLRPKRPYYTVEQDGNYTDLVYYCYGSQTRSSSTEAWDISLGGIHVGPAASWMSIGSIYYSWDDINYYSDPDLKNEVNTYYNYYQFLPLRTKSKISADVYNSFLSANGYGLESKLWDSGSAFLADQEQYGMNAAMVFSQACLESAYGTSNFAINRNNLFGVDAFDSDPDNASYYESAKKSIDNQMGLLLRQYADVENHLFFGSHFGNKGSGITVKYASSVYYGLTLSAMYYRLDKYSTGYSGSLTDWQANCVGVLYDTNTQIYSSPDGSDAMFETCYSPSYQKNFTISILGESGDYYKIQSTDYVKDGDLMHVDNYDTRSTYYDYDWTTMIGYVKKSDVNYVIGVLPNIAVKGVSLNRLTENVTQGNSVVLTPTFNPYYSTNQNVTWSSDNTAVASVDNDGVVTAISPGIATITVKTVDGGYTEKCIIAVPDVTKIKAFVTTLYKTIQDRNPDDSGLNYWTNALITGNATGTSIAYGFVFSTEFKGKNYCNEHYVTHLYGSIQGRNGDDAGISYWTSKLNEGESREAVLNGFLNSDEFISKCDSIGIIRGTPPAAASKGTIQTWVCPIDQKMDNNIGKFVFRMYTECLGRSGEEGGTEFWIKKLANEGYSGTAVARSFFFSAEFTGFNLDNTQYVMRLYKAFLGREAETGGLNYWVSQLDNGMSRMSVLQGFSDSEEWHDICTKYGISK